MKNVIGIIFFYVTWIFPAKQHESSQLSNMNWPTMQHELTHHESERPWIDPKPGQFTIFTIQGGTIHVA